MDGEPALSYVVIVTGERHWTDKETIYRVLDEELAMHRGASLLRSPTAPEALRELDFAVRQGGFILRHGVAEGADWIANEWGKARGVIIERFPADWHPPSGYNPAAGPQRNTKMARAEPRADKCCAFWSGQMRKRQNGREYSGTLDMIKTALLHQIPVRVTPPKVP